MLKGKQNNNKSNQLRDIVYIYRERERGVFFFNFILKPELNFASFLVEKQNKTNNIYNL
jgi:hypothetical protein